MAEPSSHIDWDKWGAPAVIFAVLGFLAAIAKPTAVNLLHRLWRSDTDKAVETALAVWETKTGRLKMREYMKELLAEEIAVSKKALDIAQANGDALNQINLTLEMRGVALRSIEEKVEQVPSLVVSLDRIGKSMEAFAEHMATVSEFMNRADERERLYEKGLLTDRRLHQTDPHPHHRKGD